MITRFDDMKWPYAAVVWDVVLPMQTLDKDALFNFYATRGERYNQEQQCPAPTRDARADADRGARHAHGRACNADRAGGDRRARGQLTPGPPSQRP